MPPAEVNCDGCACSFTASGLNSHLRQTHKPPCAALYARQQSYIPVLDEPVHVQPAHSPSLTPPHSSPTRLEQSFAGDSFRVDYSEKDFGWMEDDDPLDPEHLEHHSDDESKNLDFEDLFLDVADPQLQRHPHQIPIDDHDGDLDDEDDPPIPTRTQRLAAECSTSIQVPHVTTLANRYPGTQAGCPIHRSQNRHLEYAAEVADRDDPWAPFKSRMDWDIAK